MIVAGIDPGPTESGLVLYDTTGKHDPKGRQCENAEIVEALALYAIEFGLVCGFDQAIIESVECYGMPVGRETFGTCYAIGRMQVELELEGIFWSLIPRLDVKVHLCHSAKAKDKNVRQALLDRFGNGTRSVIGTIKKPGPLYGISGHLWSALALAVTWADKHANGKDER